MSIQTFVLYPWHEVISKELRALELKDGEMKRRIRELREKDEQIERRVKELLTHMNLAIAWGASEEDPVAAVVAGSPKKARDRTAHKSWYDRIASGFWRPHPTH